MSAKVPQNTRRSAGEVRDGETRTFESCVELAGSASNTARGTRRNAGGNEDFVRSFTYAMAAGTESKVWKHSDSKAENMSRSSEKVLMTTSSSIPRRSWKVLI